MNTAAPDLHYLEAEGLEILREAVAAARKAFYPTSPRFPLLRVDTT